MHVSLIYKWAIYFAGSLQKSIAAATAAIFNSAAWPQT
jgi:hypothetical protein